MLTGKFKHLNNPVLNHKIIFVGSQTTIERITLSLVSVNNQVE
nr:MAG TPA: hypothetical protein [Caudoviricetes sp.]